MASAFDRLLGSQQGRIAPTGATPAAGAFMFVLGFDTPGRVEELNLTDFAKVSQQVTFEAATKVLRASVTVRPPSAPMPAGTVWRVSLTIDNVPAAFHDLKPGARTRRLSLEANVSKLAAGPHDVTLRLDLVTP